MKENAKKMGGNERKWKENHRKCTETTGNDKEMKGSERKRKEMKGNVTEIKENDRKPGKPKEI